ncbi:DUF2939 domain-containing protein [Roseateles koreensis]|uniref:DUF2939 domain-containing protein n=1 Tax=Roseateles koreensis TaxID=2987526 RepID=A0ABT5KRM0_9BURK|nr:DUF2939 domain-containing protein [Roseateles koreensis]MDC8785578.1 DUF2939 domain-containing protein [Roseateles koreensis]
MLGTQKLSLFAAAGLLLLAACSPWWAVRQLREAADANDLARLSDQVDWPAMRSQLKLSVQDRWAHRALTESGQPTRAASLGAEVAAALLGPMVDERVSPEGLSRMLQGHALDVHQHAETEAAYESLNRFVMNIRHPADEGNAGAAAEDTIQLVLHRRGLFGWKLAELRLP